MSYIVCWSLVRSRTHSRYAQIDKIQEEVILFLHYNKYVFACLDCQTRHTHTGTQSDDSRLPIRKFDRSICFRCVPIFFVLWQSVIIIYRRILLTRRCVKPKNCQKTCYYKRYNRTKTPKLGNHLRNVGVSAAAVKKHSIISKYLHKQIVKLTD